MVHAFFVIPAHTKPTFISFSRRIPPLPLEKHPPRFYMTLGDRLFLLQEGPMHSMMATHLVPLLLAALLSVGLACARTRLAEGDSAPDFTLCCECGFELTLSKVWPTYIVVLYFYPINESPGCRMILGRFRDLNEQFLEAGARVFGVSVDDIHVQRTLCSECDLNFTLLADPDALATRLYGAQSYFFPGRSNRMTFVIDREGIIRKIYPRVRVLTLSSTVLEFVRSLNEQ